MKSSLKSKQKTLPASMKPQEKEETDDATLIDKSEPKEEPIESKIVESIKHSGLEQGEETPKEAISPPTQPIESRSLTISNFSAFMNRNLTADGTPKYEKQEDDEMNISMNRSSITSTSSRLLKTSQKKDPSMMSMTKTPKKKSGSHLAQSDPLEPLPPWKYKNLDEINARTQNQVSSVMQYSELFPFLEESGMKVKPSMTGKSTFL